MASKKTACARSCLLACLSRGRGGSRPSIPYAGLEGGVPPPPARSRNGAKRKDHAACDARDILSRRLSIARADRRDSLVMPQPSTSLSDIVKALTLPSARPRVFSRNWRRAVGGWRQRCVIGSSVRGAMFVIGVPDRLRQKVPSGPARRLLYAIPSVPSRRRKGRLSSAAPPSSP